MITEDYVITWSGSIETQAVKAQQLPPEPVRAPVDVRPVVVRYLEERGTGSIRAIAERTGHSLTTVASAIYSLKESKRVQLSHYADGLYRVAIWRLR